MANRSDFGFSGEEWRETDDPTLPISPLSSFADYPKQYGPLEVRRDWATLSLRRENAGGIGWEAYILFALAMLAVTILGLLSVIQSEEAIRLNGFGDSAKVFEPAENPFAFGWLVMTLLMLVGIPVYVVQAYKSPVIFTFDRQQDCLWENKRRIAAWKRIEYIALRETKDADGRYLYLLQVVHTDGHELLLHNGYNEREIMSLAGEIAGFIGCRTRYKIGG